MRNILLAASCLLAFSPAFAVEKNDKDVSTELSEIEKNYVNQLKEALEATYTTNPRIKAQRKFFEETGEDYNQAIAGWLPNISVNYNKGRRRNRLSDDWGYTDVEEQQLSIDQPIFRGGETWFAMDQAEHTVQAAGSQLIAATQQVLLDAITAYVDVVRDRQIATLSLNNQNVLEQQLEASQERFDVGEATRTDVSQSQARLSRAQSDAIQADGNLAISEAGFARLVGLNPGEDMQFPTKLPKIPDTLDEAIAIAQAANPRVLSAMFTEDAANDIANINKARLLPDITLRGSLSRSEGSGFTGVDYDTDAVLLNVSVPLYQGGAQYSRIRESKTQISRRRFELLEVKNEVRQQTIQAWESYQASIATINAQKDAIDAAEIALDGVKQEQLYGSRTVLDILDAEQELFIARVNILRSQRNSIVSLYNLLTILGQLSPQRLALGVEEYNQEEELDDIKYQFIGF